MQLDGLLFSLIYAHTIQILEQNRFACFAKTLLVKRNTVLKLSACTETAPAKTLLPDYNHGDMMHIRIEEKKFCTLISELLMQGGAQITRSR